MTRMIANNLALISRLVYNFIFLYHPSKKLNANIFVDVKIKSLK